MLLLESKPFSRRNKSCYPCACACVASENQALPCFVRNWINSLLSCQFANAAHGLFVHVRSSSALTSIQAFASISTSGDVKNVTTRNWRKKCKLGSRSKITLLFLHVQTAWQDFRVYCCVEFIWRQQKLKWISTGPSKPEQVFADRSLTRMNEVKDWLQNYVKLLM